MAGSRNQDRDFKFQQRTVNGQNVLRQEKSKMREKEPSASTTERVSTSWAGAPLPPAPLSAPSAAAYQISSWLAATTTRVVVALRLGSDSNRIWKCSAYTCDWGLERRKDSRRACHRREEVKVATWDVVSTLHVGTNRDFHVPGIHIYS
jgi:hypothetical protein